MGFKVMIQGYEVICDTLEDLKTVINAELATPVESPTATPVRVSGAHTLRESAEPSKPAKGSQGQGPKRAWAAAKEYAEKHGLSLFEARAELAKQKAQIEKAVQAELAKRK